MGTTKVTVNENAYDTWLEPYIGWTFEATRITRKNVFWLMDGGFGVVLRCKHNPNLFNLN